eukprot:CAMPEP_0168559282 /NCGR_PEP_ID=MMETSP0413-20121227/10436_1 /TAXON_ID=136452 /ORGANISM="Filamoeba nolandi, Strain NC-AS-23-1" /LENGTH=231 /DNA_ID=CAMNT_0008590491 /DNA_START=684 /DNA_END=1379 /DNA_ORIENTATION=+
MNTPNRALKEDPTERTLHLLQSGDKQKFDTEDFGLLSGLEEELQKFLVNMKSAGDWDPCDMIMSSTHKSIDFLSCILHKPTCQSQTTKYPQNTQQSQHIQHDPFITSSIEQGRQIFFMDGVRIKFKIPKNKPKNGAFQYQWNTNFEALVAFKDIFGHTRVTRTTPGYEELGNWVAEQRRKLKKGKITEKQFEMLNNIGFEWDRSHYFFNTYQKKKQNGSQSPELLSKSFST